MLHGKAARRYAKALLGVGLRENAAQQYGEELAILGRILTSTAGLRELLASPTASIKAKEQLLETVLAQVTVSPPLQRLLKLLLQYRRAQLLPEISAAYSTLWDQVHGVLRGTVSSAETLGDRRVQEIRKALEESTGRRVELTEEVDPDLLAGIRVHLADVVLDATIRGQLDTMAEHLRKHES